MPNSAHAFSRKGVTDDVFPAQYAALGFFFILSGRFLFKSSCIDCRVALSLVATGTKPVFLRSSKLYWEAE
jgi:hypothetical protein